MKASIIKIGNSRGVRIPKKMLEEAQLKDSVEIKFANGKVVIMPYRKPAPDEGILLSRSSLAKEWDSPEEDEAWASLQ